MTIARILELLESAKVQLNDGVVEAEERNCDIGDLLNAEKDIDEAISLVKSQIVKVGIP